MTTKRTPEQEIEEILEQWGPGSTTPTTPAEPTSSTGASLPVLAALIARIEEHGA